LQYNFEWDPQKAKSNIAKHTVGFEQAATVFRDPRAITVYDNSHSEEEDRWLTLGISANGNLLVISHTFKKIDKESVLIRIISCRKATKSEHKQYIEV
jgi:hypothetical protein